MIRTNKEVMGWFSDNDIGYDDFTNCYVDTNGVSVSGVDISGKSFSEVKELFKVGTKNKVVRKKQKPEVDKKNKKPSAEDVIPDPAPTED